MAHGNAHAWRPGSKRNFRLLRYTRSKFSLTTFRTSARRHTRLGRTFDASRGTQRVDDRSPGNCFWPCLVPIAYLVMECCRQVVDCLWNAGGHRLPDFDGRVCRSLFWLIWSTTEEMTYNGYALPRLEALCGNRWIALAIVGACWALQHSFIPFVLEWRYVVYRFISFLPGDIVFGLLYLRLRRLPPLVVAHWTMDISAILYTLQF